MNKISRRQMLKVTGAAVAGASLMGVDAVAKEKSEPKAKKNGKKKVLVIGAHPDDPESCCGGTICKMKAAGFDVVVVYMTRGERGIEGTGLQEAARIRSAEAVEACKVMGVRPVFMTQIDGQSEITPDRYTEMQNLIKEEHPDAVLVHWPIDSHRDHVNCSVLVLDAWRRIGKFFDVFYHEAMTGLQTKTFSPTDWVDITEFHDLKEKATMCHVSQDPADWYPAYHVQMERFRGMQMGDVKYAEAFVRFDQNPTNKSIMDV
ncbi:MAG: PIG-L family deacetylase [Bacteroidales bacterium]|nr:PIG-L family deacetylase [Candidatus Cacconaster equi]